MAEPEKVAYDDSIVRAFAWATVLWGIVGMSAGLLAATQLFIPELNLGMAETSFGRVRPLHTNAIIFAFVGNGIFAGVYYSLQRLCKVRMFSDKLSKLHFWGWQLIIVLAAVTLLGGATSGKEYAELEWPIDILITLIWVVFGANMLGTLARRREKHMYVAIWFYIATFVTVALLHVVNSLGSPASLLKSYSAYAGVQDALVQWWYGHNAVAFFLTTPYLGLMYYFIPKISGRPVFSYRLSIVHFWSLIFLYIWAGPHHLLFTALPDWAQSLGVVFSIMLIAPSWGGMLNGLLTLRGAWDKVREDPVLKFMVLAVTAYGMATFEGPMMSIKSVNALSHYSDWTIAHVHVAGLGWNGFFTFGMLYWLIPQLYKTQLFSRKLANFHFWIGMLGILFYAVPLYWAGITQSLMWKAFDAQGYLQYPNFLETVKQIVPMYQLRALGGLLYLVGALVMVYNLIRTARAGTPSESVVTVPVQPEAHEDEKKYSHRWLEGKLVPFTILALIMVAIGGLIEILPLYLIKSNVPSIASVHPYTPLEQYGRDIYVREGCNVCHSQMIRPFRSETERYGEYSKAGEFVYDHPFLWGSKRTGPDLHRIGGKYSDAWHLSHMEDPRSTSPGSLMPPYPWLQENRILHELVPGRIRALRRVGVPYERGYDEEQAVADLQSQADGISASLKGAGFEVASDREIIALIAYLQRLGTDIKASAKAENTGAAK